MLSRRTSNVPMTAKLQLQGHKRSLDDGVAVSHRSQDKAVDVVYVAGKLHHGNTFHRVSCQHLVVDDHSEGWHGGSSHPLEIHLLRWGSPFAKIPSPFLGDLLMRRSLN